MGDHALDEGVMVVRLAYCWLYGSSMVPLWFLLYLCYG